MPADARDRDARPYRWSGTDAVLLAAVVALLSVRPLMPETFTSVRLSFLPQSAAGPTPATTVLLDALVLTLSAVALVRHPPQSRAGKLATICVALVIAGAIVSSAAANDKRAAVNASSSFCVALIAAGALLSLARRRGCATVIVAALLATGFASAWKCVAQWWFEFDQTRQFWQEQKAALIRSGAVVDEPGVINFERRLEAREPFGYLSHPNLAASCLLVPVFAGAGVVVGLIRDRGIARGSRAAPLLVASALAGAPVFALVLIRSLGADVAVAAGAGVFGVLGWGARRIAGRPRVSTAILAGVYVGVLLGGTVYGTARGTLPHPSLAFRWHYWTAAARAWCEAPLTGIGRTNFATAFERFKPAENPEEVRDAHNAWVTLLVEMGPVACLASAALVLLWLSAALRGLRSVRSAEEGVEAPGAAIVLTPLLVAVAHASFSRHELLLSGSVALAFYWLLELAVLWAAGYAGATAAVRALREPRPLLTAGLVAAPLAMLVHNLADYSLNTPAGSVLAALAMAGALASGRGGAEERAGGATADGSRVRPWGAGRVAPWVVALVMVAAHAAVVVVPTLQAERTLAALQDALAHARSRAEAGDAMLRAERMTARDGWNSELPRELGAIALQVAALEGVPNDERIRWIRRGLEMAELSARRAPRTSETWRLTARLESALADALESGPGDSQEAALAAARAAARNWERAVELYPSHARTRIEAGKAYFVLWQRNDPPAALRAKSLFKAALALNERFPVGEVVRLSREEVASVEAHLRQLEESRPDSASQPAGGAGP